MRSHRFMSRHLFRQLRRLSYPYWAQGRRPGASAFLLGKSFLLLTRSNP